MMRRQQPRGNDVDSEDKRGYKPSDPLARIFQHPLLFAFGGLTFLGLVLRGETAYRAGLREEAYAGAIGRQGDLARAAPEEDDYELAPAANPEVAALDKTKTASPAKAKPAKRKPSGPGILSMEVKKPPAGKASSAVDTEAAVAERAKLIALDQEAALAQKEGPAALQKKRVAEHEAKLVKARADRAAEAAVAGGDPAVGLPGAIAHDRYEELVAKQSGRFGNVVGMDVQPNQPKGVWQSLISGLCVHPKGGMGEPRPGTQLILHKACFGEYRLKFEHRKDGVIMHVKGQVCVRPEKDVVGRETNVILSDKCDDESAKWRMTDRGDIQHVKSMFCVHVFGGSRSPQPNTALVLFDQCGLDRNAFALVDNVAVSIEKVIAGDPPIITDPDKLPKKVAVSILISKDPGLKNGFLDSAAAIAQSVYEAKSEFKLDLLAIVAPAVQECRPALVRMGYRIMEKPLPVELSEIKNKQLARDIETDGCCGAWEFLKLWAWTFTDYDRILQVDADIHFHRNFDEVFKYDVTLAWTHGALGGSEVMNGGFLVIRPNQQHFDEMCDIIREGNFQEGRGWLGKCCWTYGARTIQGLVPAYYLHHIKTDNWEIDRCRYNNMVEIDRCKTWRFEDVKSNHFTVCQKPWTCAHQPIELCEKFTESWWVRTEALRERLGYDKGNRCQRGYEATDWSEVPSETRIWENQIYTDQSGT